MASLKTILHRLYARKHYNEVLKQLCSNNNASKVALGLGAANRYASGKFVMLPALEVA